MLIPVRSLPPLRSTAWLRAVVLILLAESLAPAAPFSVGPQNEPVDLEGYAVVYYVSASTGSDESGQGSREAPWASINYAIETAGRPLDESRSVILVSGGIYRGKTLKLQTYLDLYGGYSAQTWERDIFAHESVLDGEDLRRQIIGANQARLDGFVLVRGRAEGHGGAILCDSSSPIITNNRFEGNHTQAPVGFRHDRLYQNGRGGGALACLYNAVPVVANNSFVGNWTEIGNGGAIFFLGKVRLAEFPRAEVSRNLFFGNVSGQEDRHGTRSSSGGAISSIREANPIIRENLIIENRALGGSDGGAIYNGSFSSPLILDNAIVGNRCDDDGAGFYTSGLGNPILEGNLIAGNRSIVGGIGGVASGVDGRIALESNTIIHNQTGGGIFLLNSFALVNGNIVAENLGGPGLRFSQLSSVFTASVIRQNAFFGNGMGPFFLDVSEGESPRMEDNHFEGSAVLDWVQENSDPAVSVTVDHYVYDPRRARTTMVIPAGTFAPTGLAGRLIQLGDRWSVVRSNSTDTLTVHGNWVPSADPESPPGPETALIPARLPALDGLEIPPRAPPPLLDPPVQPEPPVRASPLEGTE